MPDDPKPDYSAPLTRAELHDFLMWLFTSTGHVQNVEQWRREAATRPPRKPRSKT